MFKSGIVAILAAAVTALDRQPYHIQCMPFPESRHVDMDRVPEDFTWDRRHHLQVEAPEFINTLDFDKIDYPTGYDHDLAYSAPFRVVSPEGEKRLREVIDIHRHRTSGNERQQNILRGLGYHSKFIEDFLHDEELLDQVSKIAGERLCPSTFGSHIVQVNFGKAGVNASVDKWHFDSVDYVLVVILSDIEDMVGGELEVLRLNLGG
jgi:hypothetical protein